MAVILPIVTKFSDIGIRKAQSSFGGLSKSIGKLAGAAGLAVGLGSVVSLLKESAVAATADAKSQKLLALQLRTTTKATAQQIAVNEEWLSTLSMAVGVMDDELRPVLANAVRSTGSLATGQKLLAIALDGATASGKPVEAVMAALLRAHNGNTKALYRLAPELKKTKGGLDDYAASVKGAAEAGANPFDRFAVTIDTIKEKLGVILLPIITKFVNYLQAEVLPRVSKFLDDIQNPKTEIGQAWVDLQATISGLVETFADFFRQFSENGDALEGLINAMNSILKALPALLAIKGIMMLASAGKSIGALAGALRGGGGTTTPSVAPINPVTAIAATQVGAAVANDVARRQIKQKTGKNFVIQSQGAMAFESGTIGDPTGLRGAFGVAPSKPKSSTNVTVNVAPGTSPQDTAKALVNLLALFDKSNGTNIVKRR